MTSKRCRAVVVGMLCASTLASPGPALADQLTAPADFVDLHTVASSVLTDMRYSTAHNFVGRPINGYPAPAAPFTGCILTRPAAEALERAQQDFLERGYTLKVYDCYRPQRAVDDFVAWAEDLGDQRMKAEFYPRVDKSTLFDDGYIAARSGHSRGSTVDLTLVALPAEAPAVEPYVPGQPLVDCAAPQQLRFPDDSIDMGTGFDCFDTLANTMDPRIEGDQHKNRLLLAEGLERQGFANYDKEWWHYTYKPAGQGEPYPDTFFDFPVEPGSLTAQ